jgi:hypothetical protein
VTETLERETRGDAGQARRSFLCRFLSQRTAKGEVLHHVALVFVELGNAFGWEDYEVAWGLLDVAGEDAGDGGGAHDAFKFYARRGRDEAARAGLALAFAIGERFLPSTCNADWIRAGAHLEFLERHGCVLSEAERRELDEVIADEVIRLEE